MGIIITNKASFGDKMSLTQGAFSILNIPNLQAWWDASYNVLERVSPNDPAENGDPVRRWLARPDASGYYQDAANAGITAYQPTLYTYETGFANPFLQFTTNNQWMYTNTLGTTPVASVGRSIFAVVRAKEVPAAAAGTGMWHMSASNSRYPDTDGKINEGMFASALQNNITPTKNILDWQIYSVHSKSNDYRIYLGAELQFSSTSVTYSGGSQLYLGYSNSSHWNGKMAEIILFNRSLSNDQRLAVTSYLSNKYSLSL